MFPLRARGQQVSPYGLDWDPTEEGFRDFTLDLSHTSVSQSDALDMLWYAGAERVSGSEASLFTAVAPVSAVIFAFILLGEPVSLNQVIGIGAVLAAVAGLALAGRRRGAA